MKRYELYKTYNKSNVELIEVVYKVVESRNYKKYDCIIKKYKLSEGYENGYLDKRG